MSGGARSASAVQVAGVTVLSALGGFEADASPARAGVHELVRRFRAGDEAAALAARSAALALLRRALPTWPAPVTLVVVPAHDGGPQRALVALVGALAAEARLGPPTEDLLERVAPVGEAKRRAPRDQGLEAASLRVRAGSLPAEARTLVLVDDVLASGGTIAACVGAIRGAGWAGEIRGLVLAIAIHATAPAVLRDPC